MHGSCELVLGKTTAERCNLRGISFRVSCHGRDVAMVFGFFLSCQRNERKSGLMAGIYRKQLKGMEWDGGYVLCVCLVRLVWCFDSMRRSHV